MKLLAYAIVLMNMCFSPVHSQAPTQTQTVNGNNNAIVSGNNNKVHNNTLSSSEARNALSNLAPEKIFFTDKEKEKSNQKTLLILTATNFETQIIHQEAQKAGLIITKEIINDQVVYRLGILGGVDIFHMQPGMMGLLEPGCTPLILMSVFRDINPNYIIATGIAFGRQSKGHQLGDILVSRQLVNYESRKESNGDIYFRGDKVTSPMLGRVNAGIHSWKGATIHQGLVLSGNALVNSKEFLSYLSKKEPEYVGGDMESYGVYSVSSMMGAEWIMIKGISDWGDGTKNDDSHKIALQNVGTFIFHLIGEGNLT